MAAASLPGAAAFSRAHAQATCTTLDDVAFAEMVRLSTLIVVGEVTELDESVWDRTLVHVKPEAFLKGAPSGAEIVLQQGLPEPCAGASPRAADRVLIFVRATGNAAYWPPPSGVYILANGVARSTVKGDTSSVTEDALVARVRGQTGQLSRPAASEGEGASIDWMKTVLPIGAALVGLMVVGLFLMRIWHRIDPS